MTNGRQIDVASVIESQKASWFRISIVTMTSAIMLLEGYDGQVLAFAAPSIIKAWNVNRAYFGPIFGMSLFGYLLGATLLSSVADRVGRKKLILYGVLFFGFFNLVTVYAASLNVLLILRFLAGIGLGASIPGTIALTVEYFPARARATMIGVMFFGYTMGATMGGFIAARFIPEFGWQSVFYVGGLVPIALAIVLAFVLPESVRFLALTGKHPEKVAAILSKLRPDLTLTSETQYIVQEEKRPGNPVAQLFADGRSRMTLLLWFAYVTSLLGHYFLTSWLPTLLVGAGVPLAHAVITGGLLQGGGGVGTLALCWLMDRRGVSTVAISYAIAAPLIVLIAAAGHVSDWLLMGIVFSAGFCLIGGQGALNAISGTFYPTYIRSTGTGWALGIGRIGSILGPVVGGILISFNLPIAQLFFLAGAPPVCCAGAVYLIAKGPNQAELAAEPQSVAPGD